MREPFRNARQAHGQARTSAGNPINPNHKILALLHPGQRYLNIIKRRLSIPRVFFLSSTFENGLDGERVKFDRGWADEMTI